MALRETLLFHGFFGHLGYREIDLREALAVLGDHESFP
jgi:hypothetical protein